MEKLNIICSLKCSLLFDTKTEGLCEDGDVENVYTECDKSENSYCLIAQIHVL